MLENQKVNAIVRSLKSKHVRGIEQNWHQHWVALHLIFTFLDVAENIFVEVPNRSKRSLI